MNILILIYVFIRVGLDIIVRHGNMYLIANNLPL